VDRGKPLQDPTGLQCIARFSDSIVTTPMYITIPFVQKVHLRVCVASVLKINLFQFLIQLWKLVIPILIPFSVLPQKIMSFLLLISVVRKFLILSLSRRFNGHFSRWKWISRYQNVSTLDLMELGMMEVTVTAGAIRHAKLQSNRHYQQTNAQLFTGLDALPVAQLTVSKH